MHIRKHKQLLSLVCFICILFSAFPISGFAALSVSYQNTYTNTGYQDTDIVGVAQTQIGYPENGDGSTKYGTYLGYPTMEWCGAFIAWCANQAGISTSIIPANGSSNGMKDFFNKQGRYFLSPGHGGTYTPKAGDIAFFSGSSSVYNITHVGLVASVTNDKIHTIEGNYGWGTPKVETLSYDMDTARIVGFASPNYTKSSGGVTPYNPGGYNNTDGYKTGYYRTDDYMRLRSSTSTATLDNVLLTIPVDSLVKVTAIDGVWGYTSYNGKNGWMSLEYSTYVRALENGQGTDPGPGNNTDNPGYDDLYGVDQYLVVDISSFNETRNFDWEKMKAYGIKGAILRVGGRSYGAGKSIYSDPLFTQHYKNAKAAGMHIGVYFFSYALTREEAIEEANWTINVLRENNCSLDMPVFIDIEDMDSAGDYQHWNAGKSVCSMVANYFCDTVKAAGYYPGIYTNKNYAENLLEPSVFNDRAVWFAQYGVSKYTYTGRVDMWQFTASGQVDGYNGMIDLNYCYINFPALIAGTPDTVGDFGEHKAAEQWETTKEATCTAEGRRVLKCADCGIVLIDETVAKTDHVSSKKMIYLNNTSLHAGDTITKTVLNNLHEEGKTNYTNLYLPQYQLRGGTMLTYCTSCNKVLTTEYAYGTNEQHNTTDDIKYSTCTEQSISKSVCKTCKKTISEILVPYAKHESGAATVLGVTCTSAGISKTICRNCGGALRMAYTKPANHNYSQGEMQKVPTFTQPGVLRYTCLTCGEAKTEEIPSPKYGDANHNNQINAADARLVLRAAVHLEQLDAIGIIAGDVNHSGAIESADARIILRIAAGMESAAEMQKKYYP